MEKQYQLGMVLFEGFELLDVFGPLEFFGRFPERFAIRMVAENAGQLASAQGPVVVADTALGDIDKLDILLVPGGRGTRREVDNVALINDLRRIGREADIVGSICTGAGLLARTGLLDGVRATTNKLAYGWATAQGHRVQWVPRARWVEDGRFFTSAGVSAGMDMTLALIGRLLGKEAALEAARYAEYTATTDPGDDPFAALAGL